MITITQDAQFMTNYVAGEPVPFGQDFYVVSDQNGEPAVFSLTKDNRLEAVIMVNGVPTWMDYGVLLNLRNPGDVHALCVTQQPNGAVCLAVAYQSATDVGSELQIWPHLNAHGDLITPHAYETPCTVYKIGRVHKIFMSPFTPPIPTQQGIPIQHMPRLLLGLQPDGQYTQTDQLGWVELSCPQINFIVGKLNTSWKLNASPLSIYDVAFLDAGKHGLGVAVLYQSNEGTMLQYVAFEGGSDVQLHCSAQATSLTSFYDSNAQTSSLIVGGDTLTLFTCDDYTTTGAAGNPISTGINLPKAIKNMHCAQKDSDLCIWYTTSDDAVYYYSAATSSMSSGSQVAMFPANSTPRVSGLLSLRSASNVRVDSMLSVDETGNLYLIQKSADTGMWSKRAFYSASLAKHLEVPSFTFRLAATTDDPSNTVLASCYLRIKSSGLVSTLLNGVSTSIPPAGGWYKADEHGCVTLIVSTNDMSTSSITVDGFQPAKGVQQDLPPMTLDPSGDLKSTMNERFNSKGQDLTRDDLLGLTTQSGKPLIQNPSDPSFKLHADAAAKALGQIAALTPPAQSQPKSEANQDGPTSLDPGGIKEWAWEVFHYFEHVADDVVQFGVEVAEGVAYLAVYLGESIYHFALRTAQQIAKAASWVFNKISVLVQDLIDFIGFLFAWPDILDTADSIATIINTGLGYARGQLTVAGKAADDWIGQLTNHFNTATLPASKPANTGAGSTHQDPNNTPETTKTTQGAHYNWSSYQLTHGGAGTQSQPTLLASNSAADPTQDLQDMYKAVGDEAKAFVTFMHDLVTDIKLLFTPGTDTDAVFKRIGVAVVNLLQASLQNLVKFLISGTELIVDTLTSVLTAELPQMPIFSSLWSVIAEGRPFTALNLISLLLAIPTCILYKVVAKGAPAPKNLLPKLKNSLTTPAQFGLIVTGDHSADQLRKDFTLVMTATAPAVSMLGGIITVLSQVLADTPIPTALEASARPLATADAALGSFGADDLVDISGLLFSAFGLFNSWPLPTHNKTDLRWASWGLNLTGGLLSGLGWLVRTKIGTSRKEVQRIIGPLLAVIATPVFALNEAVNANSLTISSISKTLTISNIVQGVFVVIAAWSKGVTSFTDGVNDPASEIAFTAGEIIYWMAQSYRGISEVGYLWEVYVGGNT